MTQILILVLQLVVWGIAGWIGWKYLSRYLRGRVKQMCLLVREDGKLEKMNLLKVDTHVDDEQGFRIWHLYYKLLIPAMVKKTFGGMILILTERNSIPADVFHVLTEGEVRSLNNLSHVADVAAIKEFAAVNKKNNQDKIATAVMWSIGLVFALACILGMVWIIKGFGR